LGYTIGIVALRPFPAAMLAPAGFVLVPFIAQFFAAAAYQLSWAIYVSDYSRYLPRDVSVAASFWWTYAGAFIGGGWMMLVGASAAALAPGHDVAVGVVLAGDMIHAGFGPVLLLLAVLGLLTSAAQNFYGASLTLLSIVNTFVRWPVRLVDRVSAMIVCGAVAMVVALSATGDFAAGFNDFLSMLLYLFTPWTAINLVDFYLIRHGHFSISAIFDPDGIYGQWNWRGITAYFAGFAAMIPFFSLGLYHGPVARWLDGADVSMPVGLLVAATVYALACRSQDIAGELRQLPALDATLETRAPA
jgi:purine-cytosine permease-like protein